MAQPCAFTSESLRSGVKPGILETLNLGSGIGTDPGQALFGCFLNPIKTGKTSTICKHSKQSQTRSS